MREQTATADSGEAFRRGMTRRSLPPAVVKELTRQDDTRAWRGVAELLLSIAGFMAIALLVWHPLVIFVCMILIATRQQACFVIAHDAAHYRLFSNRALNDLVGRFFGMIVGISMPAYRVVHRLHHNHLYEPQDPDIPIHAGYPRGRDYLFRKLTRDLLGLTAFKTYRYFFGNPAINTDQGTGKGSRPLDDTSPRLRTAARADRWWVLGFHVTAPALALAGGFFTEYLLLWALPLVTFLQPLLRLRAICEHGAVPDTASPLRAARTNIGHPVLMWLFFPCNVHFHVEHHMYPAIPFYNLPAAHRAMRAHGLAAEAEVRALGDTLRRVMADPARKSAQA
ncbi:MAG: fatty acid desaturase family protein [Minwuia sp.]|nr:fatty acid desaturase family protein [Minwuia sp.]